MYRGGHCRATSVWTSDLALWLPVGVGVWAMGGRAGRASMGCNLSCATSAEVAAVDAASHVYPDSHADHAREKPRHEPDLATRPSEHAATHGGTKH